MVATTRTAFGQGEIPVAPRGWFLVPLFVIDEAVNRIIDGTITGYQHDPGTASLTRVVG